MIGKHQKKTTTILVIVLVIIVICVNYSRMKPTYFRFIIMPSIWRTVSSVTPTTISKLVPPSPIDWFNPKITDATSGISETNPRKRAPTELNRISSRETYFCVSFPGQTDGM